MKKLWIALGIVAVLLIGAALALRALLDPDALGREAVRRINASGTLTLEAERFRLDLLRGLSLIDARAASADGTVTVELDRLLLEHDPWPLLRGRLAVHRLLLERPRIEVVSGRDSSAPAAEPEPVAAPPSAATSEPAEAAPAPRGGLQLEIAEMVVVDGAVTSRLAGAEPDFELAGLDMTLRSIVFDPTAGPGMAGLAAHGTMRATRLRSGTIVGRETRGLVRIEAGTLVLAEVVTETDHGRLDLDDLTVDLDEDPYPYRLALAGDLDLDAILGAAEGGFGRLRLGLDASGEGPETARLAGTGSLRFEAGTFAETPLVQAIESLIGEVVLSGRSYRQAEVSYRIGNDRIEVDPFALVAEQVKLGSGGWIGLDGSLGLDLHLHLPREGLRIEELPRELLDALTGEDGFTALPLRAAGTLAAPRIELDRRALEQAAKRAARGAIEKQADRLLLKLLGGDG